jgi:xanthosine utilization system XapX-like protein
MWWKLLLLALGAGALIALLFAPIHVHMTVSIPPSRRPNETVVYSTPPGVLVAMNAVVVAGILGGAIWIGMRIVRRHRTEH